MNGKTILDFFQLIVDNDILGLIVSQTNLYAGQFIASHEIRTFSRVQAWKPTDTCEVKELISIFITMGILSYPSIEDYWRTTWPFENRAISSTMIRNRFGQLMKFLHLNDNSHYIKKGCVGHDRLYKLRPFVDSVVANCQQVYIPARELAIDESMIKFKGRLGFIQYNPKKPIKWGLKAFVLADSATGYVRNWMLYTGKMNTNMYSTSNAYIIFTGKDDSLELNGKGLGHAVVLKLLEGLEDRGHHVYLDNWYSSPALFDDLAFQRVWGMWHLAPQSQGLATNHQIQTQDEKAHNG